MTLAIQQGTQFRFYDTSETLSPAGADYTIGTPTDVDMPFSALANGALLVSAKFDLGANRASSYALFANIDPTSAPASSGLTVSWYFLPSTSTTAATGNIGDIAGTATQTPTSGSNLTGVTVSELLKMGAVHIGDQTFTDEANPHGNYIGRLPPPARYGQLAVLNNLGVAFTTESTTVEQHAVLNALDAADV